MDTTTLKDLPGRDAGRDDSGLIDSDSNLAEPYAVAKHIGGRVRLRRTRLGLSQQELADRIGLSWQQVQKYEHGVNRLVGSRLWDISCALECPVEWFFEGLAQDGATLADTQKNEDNALPDEEAELLVRAYWAIDSGKVRNRFRALMDTISGLDATETA